MNDDRHQLLEELEELLIGLDWKFSGRPEAALGSYGKRIIRRFFDTGMLDGDHPSEELARLLEAGFDSLVSDYRISEVNLRSMRRAHHRLRDFMEKKLGAGPHQYFDGVRRTSL